MLSKETSMPSEAAFLCLLGNTLSFSIRSVSDVIRRITKSRKMKTYLILKKMLSLSKNNKNVFILLPHWKKDAAFNEMVMSSVETTLKLSSLLMKKQSESSVQPRMGLAWRKTSSLCDLVIVNGQGDSKKLQVVKSDSLNAPFDLGIQMDLNLLQDKVDIILEGFALRKRVISVRAQKYIIGLTLASSGGLYLLNNYKNASKNEDLQKNQRFLAFLPAFLLAPITVSLFHKRLDAENESVYKIFKKLQSNINFHKNSQGIISFPTNVSQESIKTRILSLLELTFN
jgi:hypothetical protein